MKALKHYTLALLLLMAGKNIYSQEEETDMLSLSLTNVVHLARMQSPSVKNAQNRNVNYYWRYRNFKTRFRPQLSLNGDLPNYRRITESVDQPDGSVKFIPTQKNTMYTRISLRQEIAQTGTAITAFSDILRLKDYNNNTIGYSGSPYKVGFQQPLFQYNWMKWSKKIEPLVYKESQKQFVETIEYISYHATLKYFKYLKVQTDYNLAKNNLKNSEDNLRIATTKRNLGQISENDYSRLELSVLNARKALNAASMNLKLADFELKSYIGLDQNQKIELLLPLQMNLFNVNSDTALKQAIENRKETPQYERRILDAERQVAKAKSDASLKIALAGNVGVSNSSPDAFSLYSQPEASQEVRLTIRVPILDWGYSESVVKLAESKYDLVMYDVDKDREDFERRVIVQVEQFSLLEEQLVTALEADEVANNGYEISQRKFQNGEIDITRLNIALQEKEKAKRDYIRTLEAYWKAYYNLRILTLYDFELNKKITYSNPQLQAELDKRGIL